MHCTELNKLTRVLVLIKLFLSCLIFVTNVNCAVANTTNPDVNWPDFDNLNSSKISLNYGDSEEVTSIRPCSEANEASCFIKTQTEMNWHEANAFCRASSGFLPTGDEIAALRSYALISDLSWTALAVDAGVFQWSTRYPAYDDFFHKSDEPVQENASCVAINSESKYIKRNCDETLNLTICIVNKYLEKELNDEDFELYASSNVDDNDGWIDVDDDQFQRLVLNCSFKKNGVTIKGRKLDVFWSKDDIKINHTTSSIHPSTSIDSFKSSWLPPNVSEEHLKVTKQGTYCCESWLPKSTQTMRSNCFLVTHKLWNTMVVNIKQEVNDENAFQLKHLKANLTSLFEKYFNNYSDMLLAPMRIMKTNLSVLEYKYHLFYKKITLPLEELEKKVSKINTIFEKKKSLLKDSNMKFATSCLQKNVSLKYGNNVTYPFQRAGHFYDTKFKCYVAYNMIDFAKCQPNFINGGEIKIPKCLRFEMCPEGFVTIGGKVCIHILKNTTWNEGFSNFYKLGIETTLFEKLYLFNDYDIFSYAIDYLIDSNYTNIWMLSKRLYHRSPLINLSKNARNVEIDFSLYSWEKDHPITDMDCISYDVLSKKYTSVNCDAKNNFIQFINLDDLPKYSGTLEVKIICESGWIELPTLNGFSLCVKHFYYNSTWEMANNFCLSNGSRLASPQKGFRNWFYSSLGDTNTSWMSLTKFKFNSNNYKFDFVAWLPETNFNVNYGVMTHNGWILEDKSAIQNTIFCVKNANKSVTSKIILKRSLLSYNYLCVNYQNMDHFGTTIACFINGIPIALDVKESKDCFALIQLNRQGYYYCFSWSLRKNNYIQSNTYKYLNDSLQSYIVHGVDMDKIYKPKFHDSTFIHSNLRSSFENICIKAIYKKLSNEKVWYNLVDVNYFKLNNQFQYSFRIECLHESKNKFCLSPNNLFNKIDNIFRNHSFTKQCLINYVRSTKGCPKDNLQKKNILTYENTIGGGDFLPQELCIDFDGNLMTRTCAGNFFHGYYWLASDPMCVTPSTRTKTLWQISKEPKAYIAGKFKRLSKLTEQSDMFNEADLYYATESMEQLSKNKKLAHEIQFDEMVSIINNLMDVSPKTYNNANENFKTSATLINVFERLAFATRGFQNETGLQKCSFQKNILAECVNVAKNVSIIGFYSNELASTLLLDERDNFTDDTNVAIILPSYLPKEVVRSQKNTKNFKNITELLFAVYKTDSLFYDSNADAMGLKVNSYIVQASFENKVIENLTEKIKIYFKPKMTNISNNIKCVFWNSELNKKRGGWSEYGCAVLKTENGFVICECDHMTIFSLLIKYDKHSMDNIGPKNKIALEVITIIGCSLSIFGLVIVLTTFFLFKKWRKSLTNQILANLSFAILCSLLLFLVGIEQTWNKILCRTIAVGLHYFISASFGWMLVEGVHQYLKFVKVVGTYIPRFLWKASLCAWGIPFVPILVILIIDNSRYDNGFENNICWMSSKIFMYCFVPTISLIILINTILYSLIINNVIIKRKTITSTLTNRELMISQLSMAICVFFLLGFTWIFGLLAFSYMKVAFSYLFCIFNTLQGFLIFIFHLCRDRSAKRLWVEFLGVFKCFNSLGRSFSVSSNSSSQKYRYTDTTVRCRMSVESRRFRHSRRKTCPTPIKNTIKDMIESDALKSKP